MPPDVQPPFLFGNFVDCTGWTRQLDTYSKAGDGMRRWEKPQSLLPICLWRTNKGLRLLNRPPPPPLPCLPCVAGQTSDLPPVYYTMSSILNLFSFPKLWSEAKWATPATLQAIQASGVPAG